MPHLFRKEVVVWSLYDFANTIFSMNIISLYLKRYLVEDLGKDDRWFDIPFSISMIFVVLLIPALGAHSDHSAKKKFFVFLFTLTCCIATGLLKFIPPSFVMGTVALLIISNFAYEAAMPFYNSLLYSVSSGKEARLVSGYGVSFGYLGSILGLIVVLPFVSGSLFGLEIPFISASGKTGAFLPTAVLFFIISIPFFLWVKERPIQSDHKPTIKKAYKDVWEGIRRTEKYPGVLRFLIADYFFEDAVTTVILNIGLYCSIVVGFSDTELTNFLIISTVSAVIGSFIIGHISSRVALKTALGVIVWGWVIALLLFVMTENRLVIWILGSVVGVLLGGLWTTSRPLLGELVPKGELGKFYGLFALSGRAAAVVGPLVWTTIVYFFNTERTIGKLTVDFFHIAPDSFRSVPYKAAVLGLVVMMLVGLYIYRKVPHPEQVQNG
ncbi:MAG TPA: MFS transporter [candidate division Zixibacteria bacterium]|nr:MFS transporter [candidate division Zixibacteria bacterium]